jgi:hypothetical protein
MPTSIPARGRALRVRSFHPKETFKHRDTPKTASNAARIPVRIYASFLDATSHSILTIVNAVGGAVPILAEYTGAVGVPGVAYLNARVFLEAHARQSEARSIAQTLAPAVTIC